MKKTFIKKYNHKHYRRKLTTNRWTEEIFFYTYILQQVIWILIIIIHVGGPNVGRKVADKISQ